MKRLLIAVSVIVAVFFSVRFVFDEYESVFSESKPMMTVILDAGHGGKDGGAQTADGIFEKDIVLAITEKVQGYLTSHGVNVVLTRDGDYDLASVEATKRKMEDLRARVDIFNTTENAMLVSIHANASTDRSLAGAQTFFDPKKEENETLATFIMDSLKQNIEGTRRDAYATSSIYILKHSSIPSTLVEVGFISNEEEVQLLNNELYQEQLAYSIYIGIISYLENES